jgi:hypothetical protein
LDPNRPSKTRAVGPKRAVAAPSALKPRLNPPSILKPRPIAPSLLESRPTSPDLPESARYETHCQLSFSVEKIDCCCSLYPSEGFMSFIFNSASTSKSTHPIVQPPKTNPPLIYINKRFIQVALDLVRALRPSHTRVFTERATLLSFAELVVCFVSPRQRFGREWANESSDKISQELLVC